MYLSRLFLNPRSREVRRDLSDLRQLHRTVLAAFPQVNGDKAARAALGVLFRLERSRNGVALYVQSVERPSWDHLMAGYLEPDWADPAADPIRDLDAAWAGLQCGQVLHFRLVANPTRKVDTKSVEDGVRRNGKRVPLRDAGAQLDWLSRQAVRCGFCVPSLPGSGHVLDVRVTPLGLGIGREGAGRTITVEAVQFDGRLEIVDLERFKHALAHGVGSAKAWGMGLLSIAR
jgi:CRISPR system Cascade subunit CasE